MRVLNHQEIVSSKIVDQLKQLLDEGFYSDAADVMETCLKLLKNHEGVVDGAFKTNYVNTINPEEQTDYPGNLEREETIQNINRWNAMARVVKANREHDGLGGHISSYASIATLYEVAFNHFFKAHICYFTSLSLIGLLKDNFSVEYIENEDVIFLVCQKSNAKKFKRPSEFNPSAVSLANSRFKYKNLKEYILNGGLFKIFKKIPGAIKERYFSRGKEPKMILDSFLIRENLANESQL